MNFDLLTLFDVFNKKSKETSTSELSDFLDDIAKEEN